MKPFNVISFKYEKNMKNHGDNKYMWPSAGRVSRTLAYSFFCCHF